MQSWCFTQRDMVGQFRGELVSDKPDDEKLDSPAEKVTGSLPPAQVAGLLSALEVAGFARAHIDIVTPEEFAEADVPLREDGIRGALSRFIFSFGEDLGALEELGSASRQGATLVGVEVDGDEAMRKAGDIFLAHGAQNVTHFGRWTITSF